MLFAEPYRQTALPSNRVEWLDRHLARLCVRSELTQSQYRNAEEKYSAVGDWLAASGSSLANYAPEVKLPGTSLKVSDSRPSYITRQRLLSQSASWKQQ